MKNTYTVLDPLEKSSATVASCALAVMIKAPQAGAVKTRLVPPLTPEEAAALSICFLRDTTVNIADIAATVDADGVAVYTPIGAEAAFDGLLPSGFSLLAQRGEAFGDRLFHAAEDLLAAGYESLCLIDSDSPTLPRELLVSAVLALARPGDRVVLGAADDGGYYLIGLKRAHKKLFTGIDWSTERVLSQTIARAAEIDLEVELLPAWYDVDDGCALDRLCGDLFSLNGDHGRRDGLIGYTASHTRSYLARLIEMEGHERLWPTARARMEAAS